MHSKVSDLLIFMRRQLDAYGQNKLMSIRFHFHFVKPVQGRNSIPRFLEKNKMSLGLGAIYSLRRIHRHQVLTIFSKKFLFFFFLLRSRYKL